MNMIHYTIFHLFVLYSSSNDTRHAGEKNESSNFIKYLMKNLYSIILEDLRYKSDHFRF